MPRPRMKRLLLLLLAYAVGGAIINVAVAWGCWELRPARSQGIPYDEYGVSNPNWGVWLVGVPTRTFQWDQDREVARSVIWPGFAINTIFYAAILWLLFAAPAFVRRRIRARRGQCPACAYPVGSSTVCTECGRPVRMTRLIP